MLDICKVDPVLIVAHIVNNNNYYYFDDGVDATFSFTDRHQSYWKARSGG